MLQVPIFVKATNQQAGIQYNSMQVVSIRGNKVNNVEGL